MKTNVADKPVLPPMLESEFRAQIVELAGIYRWKPYWTWNSLHSPKGYPDLVLCKPPVLAHAELKIRKRKLTWDQQQWLELLRECSEIKTFVWRPDDWAAIERFIRGDV